MRQYRRFDSYLESFSLVAKLERHAILVRIILGSNPSGVGIIGSWRSGSAIVSKTISLGSIPNDPVLMHTAKYKYFFCHELENNIMHHVTKSGAYSN